MPPYFAFYPALCSLADMQDFSTPTALIADMARHARAASAMLAQTPTARKSEALIAAAHALRTATAEILLANQHIVQTYIHKRLLS